MLLVLWRVISSLRAQRTLRAQHGALFWPGVTSTAVYADDPVGRPGAYRWLLAPYSAAHSVPDRPLPHPLRLTQAGRAGPRHGAGSRFGSFSRTKRQSLFGCPYGATLPPVEIPALAPHLTETPKRVFLH